MRVRCEAVIQDAGKYSAFFDKPASKGTTLILSGISGECPFNQLGWYEIEFKEATDGSSESNDSDG